MLRVGSERISPVRIETRICREARSLNLVHADGLAQLLLRAEKIAVWTLRCNVIVLLTVAKFTAASALGGRTAAMGLPRQAQPDWFHPAGRVRCNYGVAGRGLLQ